MAIVWDEHEARTGRGDAGRGTGTVRGGLRQRFERLRGAGRPERRPERDAEPLRLGRDGRFLPEYIAFDDEL